MPGTPRVFDKYNVFAVPKGKPAVDAQNGCRKRSCGTACLTRGGYSFIPEDFLLAKINHLLKM